MLNMLLCSHKEIAKLSQVTQHAPVQWPKKIAKLSHDKIKHKLSAKLGQTEQSWAKLSDGKINMKHKLSGEENFKKGN